MICYFDNSTIEEDKPKIKNKNHIFSVHIQTLIFRISQNLAHIFLILFLLSSNSFTEKVTKMKKMKIEYFTEFVCICLLEVSKNRLF